MIRRYVATERNLHKVVDTYRQHNIIPILDYAVENSIDKEAVVSKKSEIFDAYPNNYHSFKLSSVNFCQSSFLELVKKAKQRDCKILLDAENYKVQDIIDIMYDTVISIDRSCDIYKTYQMYRTDMMEKLLLDIEEYKRCNMIHNIKLVRGAYILNDLNYGIIHKCKHDTDAAYNKAVEELLKISKHNNKMRVIFATHNQESYKLIKSMECKNVYHATLMGMETNFTDGKIRRMVHVPFGPYGETYPYLFRRMCENNMYLDKIIAYKQNTKVNM
jgi:hypothetical protein